MLGGTWNRRTKGLRRATELIGGQKKLGKTIGLHRSTVNKLTNDPNKNTNFKKLILIEKHTGVRLEDLDSDEEIHQYLRERNHQLILRSVLKKNILTKETVSLPYCKSNHHIIIDTDLVLISGLMNLKQSKTNTVKVVVLDLKTLLSDRTLKNIIILPYFVHSEYFAIGLRLEELMGGNRQGQRNDIEVKNKTKNVSQLLPSWGEVKGRKDIEVAKLLGYSTNTYYRGRKVYRQGIPELIDAMNDNAIRITAAAEIAESPKDQQLEKLHLKCNDRSGKTKTINQNIRRKQCK